MTDSWSANSRAAPRQRKEQDDFDYTDKNWKEHIERPKEDKRHKTDDVTNTKGSGFDEYALKPQLLRGILESGFDKPSPIQEAAIPVILSKQCVLARAKNGTGKTGAYTIPVLQNVDSRKKYIQAVILVPTRELALQTSKVVEELGRHLELRVVCATGGTYLQNDILRFQSVVHLVVGTPGRILDLAEHNVCQFNRCEMVVLDEADKLLSPDFVTLVEKI
jgi:ATP-dependent RNA helicase DDX6/DHH1